jgi:hypothetical protein
MEARDRVSEQIHGKLKDAIGEPEATLLTDRLATRDEIRLIVREEISAALGSLHQEMEVMRAGLQAEIQRSGRQQLLAFTAIMAVMNGMLGGVLTLALS